MSNGPLYEPRGAAREYGELALNIYTGCPHRCYYCFAPNVLHRTREAFHSNVAPRDGIVEKLRRQLEREGITGKTVHLCFTCDPYPTGYDSNATRECIKLLKEAGNHVQILTKGDGRRDFDLLDGEDWYGITISGYWGAEPQSVSPAERGYAMHNAHEAGIRTWISFEPVVSADDVLADINFYARAGWVDKVKIGKLNYHPSDIDWKKFGHDAEDLCQSLGLEYYIKESLRKEMET